MHFEPDKEVGGRTNGDRATAAEVAVRYYREFMHLDGEPLYDCVQDLLSDLMHLCDREDIDFSEALSSAVMNYEHESERYGVIEIKRD